MIDKQFDDILKRKLNDMTETSNSDWSAFEYKLDDAQIAFSDVKGDFDNTIKQKLAGMTSAGLSSDWSTFEQMLDEDQLTDDMLDDKVSQEMNNMRALYRQDHWELLHDSLEYQKNRNNNIIGYKVIELSLLFILLLSANNLFKYLPSTFEIEKPMMYASVDDNDNTRSNTNTSSNTNARMSEISVAEFDTQNTSIESTITPSEIQFNNQEIIASPTLVEITNQVTHSVVRSESYHNLISVDTPPISMVTKPSPVRTIDIEKVGMPVYHSDNTSEIIKAQDIAMLNLSSLLTPRPDIRTSIEGAARYTPHILLPSSKTEKSIFVYAGLDNNLVNSPFDDVYDTEGFRTYGLGYSAGVEYSIKKGKKQFSLGLGYSNRSYEPRIIEELTGNPAVTLYKTSLENIEFNIMSLSLGLQFILLETANWSLDLGIGASANIVVNSDYVIETTTIERGQPIAYKRGKTDFTALNEKPLHDGIFENGALKENIYMTTDISFGVHRKLSEKTTFTLRPEYSIHSFSDGIGPNNDLINNLSLNLGVTYSL